MEIIITIVTKGYHSRQIDPQSLQEVLTDFLDQSLDFDEGLGCPDRRYIQGIALKTSRSFNVEEGEG